MKQKLIIKRASRIGGRSIASRPVSELKPRKVEVEEEKDDDSAIVEPKPTENDPTPDKEEDAEDTKPTNEDSTPDKEEEEPAPAKEEEEPAPAKPKAKRRTRKKSSGK